MPKLTLKFKDSIINEYNFSKDKTICIGRRDSNDVVIPNLTVSGFHVKIVDSDEGYVLTDLKSKNKTYVNGEEISSILLKDNDIISIGRHTIIFNINSDDGIVTGTVTGIDKTLMLNVASGVEETEKEGSDYDGELVGSLFGTLIVVDGGVGRFDLTDKPLSIGKSSGNDIVVHGFFVGKTAAVIEKTQDGYSLVPKSVFAGVSINSRPVKQPVILKEFDSIKIGSMEFQFFLNTAHTNQSQ